MRNNLTQARLKELLDYDPETGVFTWRVSPNVKISPGSRAGTVQHRCGYRYIGIYRRQYQEHRLAVLYTAGSWPELQVDHINGDPGDNRITNLRQCTPGENQQNRRLKSKAASGFVGVSLRSTTGKWQAAICAQGRQVYLGVFQDKSDAIAAYVLAKAQLHTFQPTPRSSA